MLSKLFKTAQNRFSLTIPSQICIQKQSTDQISKSFGIFHQNLPTQKKTHPPWIYHPAISCHQTIESNFLLTVKIPRSSFLDIWHAIGCSHRSTIKEVDPLGKSGIWWTWKLDHLRPALNNSPWKGIHEGHGHSRFVVFPRCCCTLESPF